jgi:hypothetical protein
LFPLAAKWVLNIRRACGCLSPLYKALLDADGEQPFWGVTVRRIGRRFFEPGFDVYLPKDDVVGLYLNSGKFDEGSPKYWRFVIPQVELQHLEASGVVLYGRLAIRRFLNSRCEEVTSREWNELFGERLAQAQKRLEILRNDLG